MKVTGCGDGCVGGVYLVVWVGGYVSFGQVA